MTTQHKEIRTAITIQASPATVWNVFTDFEKYPDWNPFIRRVTGTPVVGQKIKAELTPPDAKGMVFTPKILAFNTNKEVRWIGRLLMPGLFDGEHIFELTDNGDGTTTFTQREYFSGLLVPLFKNMLDNNTKRGFEMMNEKLKARVEGLF